MSTTVTFDLASDDPALRAAVEAVRDDPVATWRLAVFCAQQQLEKALQAQGVRKHYDAIHLRARATRAGRREDVVDMRAGLGVDLTGLT